MTARARVPNPTLKRVDWLAKHYPPIVVVQVLIALSEALGEHAMESALLGYVHQVVHGGMEPKEALDVSRRSLELYMRESTHEGFRRNHTRYDRYLPWAAKALQHEQRRALKAVQKMARGATWDPVGRPVEIILRAKSVADIPDWALAAVPRSSIAPPSPRQVVLDYYVQADQFTQNFGIIVDWAEAESVDLGGYDLATATSEALEWAEHVQEEFEEGCEPMPPSEVVYEWPDGWTVRELRSQRELDCEGAKMHHCVAEHGEGNLVAHGGSDRIYSLRDPQNQPRVTMLWEGEHHVVPRSGFRAFANQAPPVDMLSRMLEFRLVCPTLGSTWRRVPHSAIEEAYPGWPVHALNDWQARFTRPKFRSERDDMVLDFLDGKPYHAEDLEATLVEVLSKAEEEAFDAVDDWVVSDEERTEAVLAYLDDAIQRWDPKREVPDADIPEEERGDLQWQWFVATGQGYEGDSETDEMIVALRLAAQSGWYLPGLHHRSVPASFPRGRALRREARGLIREELLHPPGRVTGACLRAG